MMARSSNRVLFSLAFVLVLLFFGALALRIYRIDHQSLWMDEAFTLYIAPLPWSEMSDVIIKSDNGKPPLYNLFMHEWLLYGTSVFWVRLPSAIFGAITCIAAGLLGTLYLGRKGWIVGLLLAFSPFHIWYSQETRLYALLGLGSSFAFYFHARFCREGNALDIILFTLFAIITCYTFPYGFFILAVTGACAFFQQPRLSRHQLLVDAVAHFLSFATFVPWIFQILKSAETTYQVHKGHDFEILIYSFNYLVFGSSIGLPPETLHQISVFSPLHDNPAGCLIFLLSFSTAFLTLSAGLKILWRKNWNAFVFSSCGLVVFLGAPFVIALIKPSITNNPRYAFMALLPAMIALAAFLLQAYEQPNRYHRILAGFLAAGISLSLWNYYFVDAYSRVNLKAVGQALEQDQRVDAIFICNDCEKSTLTYYYHGSARVIPISFFAGESADQETQQVKSLAASLQYPALVYVRPDLGDPKHHLPTLFQELFHPIDSQQWTGVTLYRYQPASLPSSPH